MYRDGSGKKVKMRHFGLQKKDCRELDEIT